MSQPAVKATWATTPITPHASAWPAGGLSISAVTVPCWAVMVFASRSAVQQVVAQTQRRPLWRSPASPASGLAPVPRLHPNRLRNWRSDRVRSFEAAAFKHRRDNVLADIVQVALYCPDDHAHGHPLSGGDEQRPNQFHRALHGAAGQQKLWDEVLLGLKQFSYLVHCRHHRLGNQLHRFNARGQLDLGGGVRLFCIAVENCVVKLFGLRHISTSEEFAGIRSRCSSCAVRTYSFR